MSSAFLKGMLRGQAGWENPSLWEKEQSWPSSRAAFEHGTALGRVERKSRRDGQRSLGL